MTNRLAQTRSLGSALLDLQTNASRAELRFEPDSGTRAEIDRFVGEESRCCPFLEFDVRVERSATVLAIEAPEDGISILRGLVAGLVAAWELPS